MSDFSIDVSEVNGFVDRLGRITDTAIREVDAVAKKGAQNMKEEMSADIRTSRHFVGKRGPGFESSISYDQVRPGEYVVGPDKDKPGGPLGNIYYFGTSRGGGTGDIEKPMNSERPRFEQALTSLISDFGGRL